MNRIIQATMSTNKIITTLMEFSRNLHLRMTMQPLHSGGDKGGEWCSTPSNLSKFLCKFKITSQIHKKFLLSAPLNFKS